MTIRLSTGARNAMLGDNVKKGLRESFNLGFINIYDGTQPASADTGATGNLLGTVTVNDGGTGITFDVAASGVLSKAAAETWKFHGLTNGTAGWFRLFEASDTPTANSSTARRVDGLIGTAGADVNISNTSIVTSAVSTVDTFTLTMPAS